MSTLNGGELAANAARALERYRAEERRLEEQAAAIAIHLMLVKEFIAALTAAPRPARGRPPKTIEPDAPETPPHADMELAG